MFSCLDYYSYENHCVPDSNLIIQFICFIYLLDLFALCLINEFLIYNSKENKQSEVEFIN